MLKLTRYVKKSLGVIGMILLLLIFQAYCDLELPNYTSKIVTQGIQQKGIEDNVPDRLSEDSMNHIQQFLSEEDGQKVLDCYTSGKNGYKINKIKKEERAQLSEVLLIPEMILTYMNSGEVDEQAMQMFQMMQGSDQSVPGMDKSAMLEKIKEQFKEIPENIKVQSGIVFVQKEYETLGENLDARQTGYMIQVGIRMLLLALLAMMCTIGVTFLSARMAAGAAHDIRNDVFRKVLSFQSQEYNKFSTASLITRSTNDIQQVQMFLAMGFRMILYAPIIGIGGIVKVLNTQVSMTWIIALAVALISLLIIFLFTVAMPRFKMLQVLIDKLNQVAREQISGVMVTRAFSAESHEEGRFEKANYDLYRTNLFVNRCMTFMMPLMMIIMNCVSILIIYSGGHAIDQGNLQVGDMMAFIQYAMQVIMSFLMISVMSIMIPRANVAANRIQEVLSMDVQIKDPENPKTPEKNQKGIVEFDHVSFAYPDADENVLTDITFRANSGETVAFIGGTGSGKSTLINLIPRFFDVTKGSVKIDGVDVRDYSKDELCSRIGYVPQKSILFSGTIESNIKFGKTDATLAEVMEAADLAQASDFIMEKEENYKTSIAQGGTNVSGGQKQRLSIARALAAKPEILIFDDSFSALDFKTDAALRKALSEKTKNTTKLIVAQRISTILHADQIIVLDEGKMVGHGKHEELLKNCEVYREVAMSQLSEEELG